VPVLALAFPDDGWRRFRAVVFLLGLIALALASSGVAQSTLYQQPSTTKFAVTVFASAFVCLLCTIRSPFRFVVGLAVVVAPVNFVMTFNGLQITPLIAVDLLALLVALPRLGGGSSSLRFAALGFALLLLPAIVGAQGPGHWFAWLAVTIATGWLVSLVAREDGGPRFVAYMLLVSGVVQAALAIYEFRSGHALNLYTASGTTAQEGTYFFRYGSLFRPAGALPDPIGLGQVLALVLPLGVVLVAYHASRLKAAVLPVMVAVGVVTLALMLTLSRMSIVAGAVGALIALLLLPRRALLPAAASIAVVGLLVGTLAFALAGSGLTKRLDSILNPTAAHVSTAQGDISRQHIWQAAIKTAEAHPLTGVGLGRITDFLPRYGIAVTASAHAHDTYLQFAAEAGILGLVGLVWVILAAGRDLLCAFSSERLLVAGATGSLIATLVAWSTDVEVRYTQVSGTVAVLLGLIAAMAIRSRHAREA
jgi:O-antigen ligase